MRDRTADRCRRARRGGYERGYSIIRPHRDERNLAINHAAKHGPGDATAPQVHWALRVIRLYREYMRSGIWPAAYPSEPSRQR